jgi:hypothetical protein
MNRFVPLDYKNFKRFSMTLRKTVDLTHTATLQALARACGFSTFHEITLMDRAGSEKAVPMTLQCSGEIGFAVWVGQLHSVFGRGVFLNLASKSLRTWYARLFEVGAGVRLEDRGPQLEDSRPRYLSPLGSNFLDIDRAEARNARAAAQQVLVTYRKRRRVVMHEDALE